jgi:hypothetical protein
MESAKQERKNLMNDMPIVNRASGSWMSKHSRAAVSPVEMGGSDIQLPLARLTIGMSFIKFFLSCFALSIFVYLFVISFFFPS